MVATANPTGNIPVVNGSVPCEGTKILPFSLDFTAGPTSYSIDFTQVFQQKQFSTLQTVWIDNSENNDPLSIVCNTSNQIITAPARSQGYYALLQPTPGRVLVQTAGSLVITIIFLNFYIPPTVWPVPVVNSAGLPEVDIPALDAVISGGRVQTESDPFTIQGLTDASGTIAVAATAQVAIPASAARKRWTIANPSTQTEILQIMWGAAAAGRIDLLPGASWDESGSSIVGEAVYVIAATLHHPFTAYYK